MSFWVIPFGAALLLLDSNPFGSRRNPVCDDLNPTCARFYVSWNIDGRGCEHKKHAR